MQINYLLILIFKFVIATVFLVLSFNTFQAFSTFYHFKVHQNVLGSHTLSMTLQYENKFLLKNIKNMFFKDDAANKRVDIFIDKQKLNLLNSDLPNSGFNYQDAKIIIDNKILKSKVRYRGTLGFHWANKKKSFRVKLDKSNLYNNIRSFNILAPDMREKIQDVLAYNLASSMNIYAPHAEVVRLFVNNVDYGNHILIEQVEESFLRNRNLMPGDIYDGDTGSYNYSGSFFNSFLFENQGNWEKKSINNHYDKDHREPLKYLITSILNKDLDKIENLIDLDSFAKLALFFDFIASTHIDERHNWKLYYDPWKQKFFPIIWDPAAWMGGVYKINLKNSFIPIVHTDLMKLLNTSGKFHLLKNRNLDNFFEKNLDNKFLQFHEDVKSKYIEDMQSDPYLIHGDRIKNEDFLNFSQTYVKKIFNDARSNYKKEPEIYYELNENKIYLSIDQNSIDKLRITKSNNFKNTLEIIYKIKDKNIKYESIPNYKISNNQIVIDQTLIPNIKFHEILDLYKHTDYRPGHLTYTYEPAIYEISFSDKINDIDYIEYYKNGSWHSISTKKIDSLNNVINFSNYFNDDQPLLTFQGDVIFDKSETFEQEVIIKPGTNFYLGPNVSLFFKNKIYAVGTSSHSINIHKKNKNAEPWGTFAIESQKANDSVLKFINFYNGSGYKNATSEYSGMLSIHHVDNILIDNCKLENSFVVDDMLHLVYSSGIIENSFFKNSLSDAIDIDISNFIVRNNTFINSGNDALDLMSSKVLVHDNYFYRNGDKGISVGEKTEAIVINNHLNNNLIGIEIKDQSKVISNNNIFISNKTAINAYDKNWRYEGGGKGIIANSILIDNETYLNLKDRSLYLIHNNNSVEKEFIKNKKILALSKTNINKLFNNNNTHETDLILDLIINNKEDSLKKLSSYYFNYEEPF